MIADKCCSLAFLANPAEEEAIPLIWVGMLHQAFSKSQQPLNKTWNR